jgi:hypothetical protein
MSSEPSGVTNFSFRVVLDGGFRVARVDGGFGRGLFVRADRRGGVGKQVSAEIGDDSFRLLEGVGEVTVGDGEGKVLEGGIGESSTLGEPPLVGLPERRYVACGSGVACTTAVMILVKE